MTKKEIRRKYQAIIADAPWIDVAFDPWMY